MLGGKCIGEPIRAPNLTLTAANGGSGSTRDCTDTSDNDNGETLTRKIHIENEYFKLPT